MPPLDQRSFLRELGRSSWISSAMPFAGAVASGRGAITLRPGRPIATRTCVSAGTGASLAMISRAVRSTISSCGFMIARFWPFGGGVMAGKSSNSRTKNFAAPCR